MAVALARSLLQLRDAEEKVTRLSQYYCTEKIETE